MIGKIANSHLPVGKAIMLLLWGGLWWVQVGCSLKTLKRNKPVIIKECFLTPLNRQDDIDSPAIWHGAPDRHWLLVTAKKGNRILVYDAASGTFLRAFGQRGKALGQFQRPNGLLVIGDLAIVVERDNHRLQLFRLPSFTPLGIVGERVLRRPYGISGYRKTADQLILYVTDNYRVNAADTALSNTRRQRIKMFKVQLSDSGLQTQQVQAFGEADGAGALYQVESIAVDTLYRRLLIADEHLSQYCLKVYNPEGQFTGQYIGKALFRDQPEGIVLYACRDGGGYWIATEQSRSDNRFHVFERRTLKYLGSFSGMLTRNTDGIALTQKCFGQFRDGAFYAVHNDGSVAAMAFEDIARELNLPIRCLISN